MDSSRYKQLEKGPQNGELTAEELADGWHWCNDFDGMLVGPGTVELLECTCDNALINIARQEAQMLQAEVLKVIPSEKGLSPMTIEIGIIGDKIIGIKTSQETSLIGMPPQAAMSLGEELITLAKSLLH